MYTIAPPQPETSVSCTVCSRIRSIFVSDRAVHLALSGNVSGIPVPHISLNSFPDRTNVHRFKCKLRHRASPLRTNVRTIVSRAQKRPPLFSRNSRSRNGKKRWKKAGETSIVINDDECTLMRSFNAHLSRCAPTIEQRGTPRRRVFLHECRVDIGQVDRSFKRINESPLKTRSN